MAGFKIPENGEDITTFDLPAMRDVTLVQWGGDFGGNQLDLDIEGDASSASLVTSSKKLPAASTEFTLRGFGGPSTFRVTASSAGTGRKFCSDLAVNILPRPKKQDGYTVDLISDLATKGNAQQIQLYTKLMTQPAPLLGQDTRAGHYNCGDIASTYGKMLNGIATSTTYNAYYLPPTSSKMKDLRFDVNRMRGAIARIQSLLNTGTSVRVWLIHDDDFAPNITSSDPTHFVTIVGYGGNKFLFIDPWPDGSQFPYNGGMYKPRRTSPTFFGEFEFDLSNLSTGIHESSASHGSMPYTIIAGP